MLGRPLKCRAPVRICGGSRRPVLVALRLPRTVVLLALEQELGALPVPLVASDLVDAEDHIEKAIGDSSDIGPTEREQLVKSRRGQGLFRARVCDLLR